MMVWKSGDPASRGLNDDLKAKARRRRKSQTEAHRVHQRSAGAPTRNDPAPVLELVDWPLEKLQPPKRSVRKLDTAHITEVAASIAALGFCDPIVIAPDGTIMDGVTRYAAAKQLGMASAPCILLSHLTPATERAARIALNRLGDRQQRTSASASARKADIRLVGSGAPSNHRGHSMGTLSVTRSYVP